MRTRIDSMSDWADGKAPSKRAGRSPAEAYDQSTTLAVSFTPTCLGSAPGKTAIWVAMGVLWLVLRDDNVRAERHWRCRQLRTMRVGSTLWMRGTHRRYNFSWF